MNHDRPHGVTRRGLLKLSAVAGSSIALGTAARGVADASGPVPSATHHERGGAYPFWGAHQGGILTPQQSHTYFIALDLTTDNRRDVAALLRTWTAAAARMTAGGTAQPLATADLSRPAADSGETLGLPPARLTVTFGFGAGLFSKDGSDRYGLAARRPDAFVDLPKFNGEQLIDGRTGGDLSIQACADDPQVAFHAVRQLVRLASDVAQVRWAQAGFMSGNDAAGTPRNLMGFKDGTQQPDDAHRFVWVGSEGPAWIRGGSYLVARRARIALEHWDRMNVAFQEQGVGRRKYSGAPLGAVHERDPLPLDKMDADGNPVLPQNAHVRLATAKSNNGAQILRRSYSYNDGVAFTAERWPPWKQGMEYDAGLLFICYQRDPRTGFIPINEKLAAIDMLNQFVTHNGGGIFACPPGAMPGEYVGQRLLEA